MWEHVEKMRGKENCAAKNGVAMHFKYMVVSTIAGSCSCH